MTKKIEIELPEMTQEKAEKFEHSKDEVKSLYDKAHGCGLDIYEFCIARKHGYTIKQEPKYYIKLFDDEDGYLNIDRNIGTAFIDNNAERDRIQTKFTESEIKNKYSLLWNHRELVEE